jgi:1A family penicillin-binding protein
MPQRRFHRSGRKSAIVMGFSKKKLVSWGLMAAGVLFLGGAGTVLWWSKDLPDPQSINQGRVTESTKIFDSTGQHLLYEIGEAKRTSVGLKQVSSYVVQATLAAEDDKFYEHHGIAITGIIRGVILKPLTGQRAQGGSTITQQLIKNSFLTPERTPSRKAKEMVLAIELEQKFSKDEILEMYLNSIPYGSRTYGIEAATQTFFGTNASNVTLAQAAYLAALPQAPSYYSPYGSHIEDLKGRQEYILGRMANLKMITAAQADAAKKEEVAFQPARENIQAPHFVFYVKELLEEEFGERIVEQGGLKVTTTLDMRLQKIAEDVLKNRQDQLKKLGASNGALVAINPKDGHILAMTGSLDYFNEEIDGNVNVAIRHRSPGSSIKPFVYAAAFNKGYTPETVLVDAETDFGQGYKPKNYNLKENGPVTMRQALANSLNIPAVQTLYLAGVKEATKLAHDMGMDSLTDPDRYGLSLVLGGGEVRLLDEVSAYGVFANEGVRFDPVSVLKVEDKEKTLFDIGDSEIVGREVISPQTARLVTSILSDNNARGLIFGTNTPLQLGSRPVAAKTGTTQDFRDGWTMGFTPSLAAGVWTGNNDNSPMGSRSDGVVTAGPIWNAFMRQALANTPIEQFTAPEKKEVPQGVLRNELTELKGRWVEETQTLYTVDCPVSLGQIKTFKELHSILFYVRRDNPQGPPPERAENDPQFDNWESAVAAWRDKHNAETKDKPEEPVYLASLPTPSCNIGNPEDIPKVRIVEPTETKAKQGTVTVKAEVDSPQPLKEVRFVMDGKTLASRTPADSYSANVTFSATDTGRKTVQVLAITENNLVGQGHITFLVNSDDSAPAITLHTPQNNSTFKATNFPQIVKVTATDKSGIASVDVLFQKEDSNRTSRIGRTDTVAPTAANRYEVSWKDSPGPGVYQVYAVAYDKTGNSTESARHTVTVE